MSMCLLIHNINTDINFMLLSLMTDKPGDMYAAVIYIINKATGQKLLYMVRKAKQMNWMRINWWE